MIRTQEADHADEILYGAVGVEHSRDPSDELGVTWMHSHHLVHLPQIGSAVKCLQSPSVLVAGS